VAPTNDFASYLAGYSNRMVGATLTYSVTGLQAQTAYYYRVRAQNETGIGGDSATQTVTAAALALSSGSLTYTGTYGGANPAVQAVVVTNLGARGFDFTNAIGYSVGAAGWWTATPYTGSVNGLTAVAITGAVNLTTCNAGVYYVTNTIGSAEVTNNSPQIFVAMLTVSQASQTIAFGNPGPQLTTNSIGLVLTSDSGLAVTGSVISGSGYASIANGTNLTFTGYGDVTIRASQTGAANYAAATPVDQTCAVTRATAIVSLTDLSQIYNGTARPVTTSTVPVGLPLTVTYAGDAWAPTNAGSYVVTGMVDSGHAMYQGTSVVTLTVNAPAAITTQPQSRTNDPGSAASFTVTAAGTAPLFYQWQKGVAPITLATNATYTIGAVMAGDAGNYRCLAANMAGTATSAVAVLTVTGPAVIIGDPQSQTNNPGSAASFTVAAAGTAPLFYQWQKDSANIGLATNTTYTIGAVIAGDAGDYRCLAGNMLGVVTSAVAVLTVNAPPVIMTDPQTLIRNVGEAARFIVSATGTAPLFYQWQKNGAVLDGATGASYTIAVLAVSDTGNYRCLAANMAGTATSAVAVLTVNAVPPPNPPPSAPTGVSASDGMYSNKVQVIWNAVSGATSYEVWRSTANDSGSAGKLTDVAPGLTAEKRESRTLRYTANQPVLAPRSVNPAYDDTSAAAGATYYYWVKAVNAGGASAFSSPDSGYAAVNQTPTGNADLALASLIFLPNRLKGGDHPGILAMVLINNGPQSLALLNTRLVVDVYLSPDTTLGNGDDLWLGDYQMDVNLSAGHRTTISASGASRDRLTIPSTAAGRYYVFAKVRPAAPSTLADPNTANNFVTGATTINISSSGALYHPINDYNGDGKSDLALYEPATGFWYILGLNVGSVSDQFGDARFLPCPGDFDGDGQSDYLIYTALYGGYWMVYYSGSQTIGAFPGGGLGCVPLRGDFDGDGQSDFGVYEEAAGNWIMLLSTSGQIEVRFFGAVGYDHVSGDFDGDGKTDPALYNAAGSYWFWLPAGAQMPDFQYAQLGWPGSTPIPGDYDGDGTTDLAVYHPAHGWKIRYSSGGEIELPVAISGTPVVGDYDGDGKVDIAIYLPSGLWLIALSTTGEVIQSQFGGFGGLGQVPVQ
jgi:hypothetical protein